MPPTEVSDTPDSAARASDKMTGSLMGGTILIAGLLCSQMRTLFDAVPSTASAAPIPAVALEPVNPPPAPTAATRAKPAATAQEQKAEAERIRLKLRLLFVQRIHESIDAILDIPCTFSMLNSCRKHLPLTEPLSGTNLSNFAKEQPAFLPHLKTIATIVQYEPTTAKDAAAYLKEKLGTLEWFDGRGYMKDALPDPAGTAYDNADYNKMFANQFMLHAEPAPTKTVATASSKTNILTGQR